MPTAEQMVASSVTLVTLPAVFIRVKSVVDDQTTTAIDLAKVISTDAAMTARVLKLINSAFWGFGSRIDSLSRAVSLLGMIHVHDLVLATSVLETFERMRPEQMDVAKFWRGSLFRGLAATALARKSNLVDLGRVFVEALMSDLGHMVLYLKAPELAARAMKQSREQPWELARLERALIGCDFAQVGGELTDSWRLPPCFGETIRYQNDPQGAGEYALEASLLHIAAIIAKLQGSEREKAALVERISPSAWQIIGLSPDCLPEIIFEVETHLSATARLFGLPVSGAA